MFGRKDRYSEDKWVEIEWQMEKCEYNEIDIINVKSNLKFPIESARLILRLEHFESIRHLW